jgi:hypothetical protein
VAGEAFDGIWGDFGRWIGREGLQEWMGHRDFKTTLIYADYAPSGREAELMDRAFGTNLEPDWSPARTAGGRPTVAR